MVPGQRAASETVNSRIRRPWFRSLLAPADSPTEKADCLREDRQADGRQGKLSLAANRLFSKLRGNVV